jgi:hypothetical protein
MKFMEESVNTTILTDVESIVEEDVMFRIDVVDRELARIESRFDRADSMLEDLIMMQKRQRPLPNLPST